MVGGGRTFDTNKYKQQRTMLGLIKDPYFRVALLRATPNPQQLCYLAAHQDYSSEAVIRLIEGGEKIPSEKRSGEILIERCLQFQHYGVVEHPQITFNCASFPHSVMVQARTHRVGISFDCQSQRYTSQAVLQVIGEERPIEEVFYFRPFGDYSDRQGKKYSYSIEDRVNDVRETWKACLRYKEAIDSGRSEEHARELLPQNIRQHFVVSFNARSLMHFLDLRSKADAQAEIITLSYMLFDRFKEWMPEIATFYEQKRLSKARLAP
jgi:thymidylate synthase (FAD)